MDWPERWLCSWEATVLALLVALSLVALTGCKQSLDLDAVRELASNAATAQASADAVAEDFYDTCVRRNIYLTVSSEMRAKFPIESLTKQPASEQAVAGTSASPATTYDCSNERAASKSWRAANDVLFGYYVALGKLAGGARSNDSFGVKALATDLSGSSVMSSGQASAIGGLANDVLDEIYDAKRRGALAGYIAQADASVAAATKMLTGIATDSYAFSLKQEATETERFLYANLALAKPGAEAFQVLSFADSWTQREQAINDRSAAATSYVDLLEKLQKSHAALLQAIDRDNTLAAFDVAKSYFAAMKPDIEAIDKAYAPKGK